MLLWVILGCVVTDGVHVVGLGKLMLAVGNKILA
jgi:hypothetical protein